jgi:hypothetical protein
MPVASSLAVALLGISLTAPSPAPLLRLQDPALWESSGLAASARHDGILWTHADGGTSAEVRAVDRSGQTVATVTLAGVDPYDPEAIAPGPGADGQPALFLGDIGDNGELREDVSVFRFGEPARLRDQTVQPTWFRFTYPEGPRDAEALLVEPETGRIMIATKKLTGGDLYRAPQKLVTADQGSNELELVADAPGWVTDGSYLPDGRFVLRTYGSAFLYDRPGHEIGRSNLPLQQQGESLTVEGDQLLVGSEGENSAVYAVPVPSSTVAADPTTDDSAGPSPTATGDATDSASSSEDGGSRSTAYGIGALIAAAALLVALLARAARRRSRRH